MTNLNNTVLDFRRHFNITGEDEHVFKLDPDGNLISVWNNRDYYLTNKRNPTKFLSVSTMQFKLKYGIDFFKDLKWLAPQHAKVTRKKKKKEKPKPAVISLEDQIKNSKKFHNILDDSADANSRADFRANFKVVDGKLSALLNGKYVPFVKNGNALANSTLQVTNSTLHTCSMVQLFFEGLVFRLLNIRLKN